MNPQPDTSTLDGKIAVMEASKTRRIELRRRHSPSNAWYLCDNPKNLAWNWEWYDFRVHPADLNPPPPPSYRPWKPEEVPVGRALLHKCGDKRCKHLILNTEITGVYYSSGDRGQWSTYESLLEHFTLEDGSPCGVREG